MTPAKAPTVNTDLLLFPTHPLFVQLKHPQCPACLSEITPQTPVDIEELPGGMLLYRHSACVEQPQDDGPQEAI